jgi:RNA polymerase sigma-70 factor (ECF subfamily)
MGTTQTASEGSHAADRFRSAHQATYADLLRFVTRRTSASDAEDVVAEAFLVAWRRVEDLPMALGDQRAWLFGIARNCLLNDGRSHRRHDALAVRIAEHPPVSDQELDEDFLARRLDIAAWDGLTGPEAAAVLGISPVAFRLRLSRARKALRLHLDLVSTTATARERTAR